MFYSPHPLLRKRETETATVSYSELLFDLIYVFSVTQLSHYLLHNLTWEGLLKETILWFAVWMLWQHTIWVTNWFNPDTRPIRILLFISMLVGPNMELRPKEPMNSAGIIAISIRKNAPNRVRRLHILARYSPVGLPGRMPGIKPPFC